MSYTPGAALQSIINYSQTPLTSGSTYTGTWERNPYGECQVRSLADQAGTLYIDFSTNGGTSTISTITYTCAANSQEIHRLVSAEWVRLRYTNGGVNQTSFDLSLRFGVFGPLTSSMTFTISDDADAVVTKSVVSGIGNTTARVSDQQALNVSPPPEGRTAFGEALVGSLEPVIQLVFPYSINPYLVTAKDNGGSLSISNSMATLSTGAAANQSSTLESVRKMRYEPGLGARARFTAIFTTGAANSTQIIGIGDSGEGFFVGYNGTSFGVLHRYGGAPEIRTLTVSTASSTAENITITLDGNADATVAVTNTGDTTLTANEIAAHDYSGVGRGWTAKAVGSTVVFTSWDSSSRTGTYSLSGATTAVGSFAQTLAGVAPTEEWTAQASWNGDDIFDGNGLTGVTLDPTKGNVFQIDFQYLGFGGIAFYVEDPDDRELHLFHTIEYANAHTTPSLDNPTLPLYASVENTSNTSDIVLKTASMATFIDGKRRVFGVNRGVEHNATVSSSGETPVTSFRVNEVFNSQLNRSEVKINIVAGAVEHTKPVQLNFYANATLTGASYSAIDSGNSTIFQDTSATALSNGVFLFSMPLSKTGQSTINLLEDIDLGRFAPGDALTVAAEFGSGTNAEVRISFNVTEML